LRVPGPPAGAGLAGEEIAHPDPRRRFARRAIQYLGCAGRCETLALIDKASPHSRWDLMLSEVSPVPRSTPAQVLPATGRTLWRTGLAFVRYCSLQSVAETYGLAGGELHLALNCDPHTLDRESVQAAKQFHLHLLCWDSDTLAPLAGAGPLGAVADRRLRRQALDPLTFLGARLVADCLRGLDLGVRGIELLGPDPRGPLGSGAQPGCILRLPGWGVLGLPPFEDLIRRIHRRLESLAADLLEAFAGRRDPPAPWHRHPLLPPAEIQARVAGLSLGEESKEGLGLLAWTLRSLAPATARRLARAAPARRQDLMTLCQPCYALSLHAAAPGVWPPESAGQVDLAIAPRLFSGIGGAGLLALRGVPSVRVIRGQGRFSTEQWRARAEFQAGFARFNRECLKDWGDWDLEPGPVRRFAGPAEGWVDSED
jgi:hypothetical protein